MKTTPVELDAQEAPEDYRIFKGPASEFFW